MKRFQIRMLPFFLSILMLFSLSGCASGKKNVYKDTVFLGMDTYITIRLPQGELTDALSTALFVMGADEGLSFYDSGKTSFEAIFVTDENEIYLTDGLKTSGVFALSADGYRMAD